MTGYMELIKVCPLSVVALSLVWINFTKGTLFQGPVPPGSFLYHIGNKICYVTAEAVKSTDTPLEGRCIVYNIEGSTVLGVRRYGQSLFLGDSGNSELERRYLDRNRQFIVSYSAHHVTGLAVDWSSNVVYWTEKADGTILAARTDGNQQLITAIFSNLDGPTGLAVHPNNRHLYWGETGSGGRIFRSFTDGTAWEVFLEDLGSPGDLTVDQPTNRLYWVDLLENSIKSVDLNGRDRRVVVARPPDAMIRGITISQFLLSWAETGSKQGIHWANKTDGTEIRALRTSELTSDVVYFGRYPSDDTAHGLCTDENGGCAHICLHNRYNHRVCRCSFGYETTDDGKTCFTRPRDDTTFLLVSDIGWWDAFQLPLDSDTPKAIKLPLGDDQTPIGAQYDTDSGLVYWIDRSSKTVRRSRLDGTDRRDVYVMSPDAAPESLALDQSTQNIYVTDRGRDVIFRVTTEGEDYVNITSTGLEEPRDLILDTEAGFMYWTDWGTDAKIERADIRTGDNRETITSNVHTPYGLTADFQAGYLYWTDAGRDRIERSALDGSGRKIIAQIPNSHLYGLALSGQYLYAADRLSRHLKRVDRETGDYADWGPGLFQATFQIKVINIKSTKTTPASTDPPGTSGPNLVVIIGACVGAGVVIATIITIALMARRRRQLKHERTPSGIENPAFTSSAETGQEGSHAGSVSARAVGTGSADGPQPYAGLYGNHWEAGSTVQSTKKQPKSKKEKHSKKQSKSQNGFVPFEISSSVASGSVASRNTSVSMVTDTREIPNIYGLGRDDKSTVSSRSSDMTSVSFNSTTALFSNRK